MHTSPSQTVHVKQDEIVRANANGEINPEIDTLCKGVSEQLADSSNSLENLTSFLRIKRDAISLSFVDILDYVPMEHLKKFSEGCREALASKDKSKVSRPPLLKLDLYFSDGKDKDGKDTSYPYAVSLFALPPLCDTPIHSHTATNNRATKTGRNDYCVSAVLGGEVKESSYVRKKDENRVLKHGRKVRRNDTPIAVIENGSYGNDIHKLKSTVKTFDKLAKFVKALDLYIAHNRERTQEMQDSFNDSGVAYSLHVYEGVDGKKLTSSVAACNFKKQKLPNKQTLRPELAEQVKNNNQGYVEALFDATNCRVPHL